MGYVVEPEIVSTEEDVIGILKENWAGVQAFLMCQTQWRAVAGETRLVRTGLDYACVDVVMRRGRFPDDVFFDLRILEDAALLAFSEVAA